MTGNGDFRKKKNKHITTTTTLILLFLILTSYITNRARRPYWGIFARGRDSTDLAALGPYENDRGPIFPGTTRASLVSK